MALALAAQPQPVDITTHPRLCLPGLAGTRIRIPGFQLVEQHQAVDGLSVAHVMRMQHGKSGGPVGIGQGRDWFAWHFRCGMCAVIHRPVIHTGMVHLAVVHGRFLRVRAAMLHTTMIHPAVIHRIVMHLRMVHLRMITVACVACVTGMRIGCCLFGFIGLRCVL